MGQKYFVLDTNILLQEPASIFGFEEHVVVISHVVLHELDKIKSENRNVSADARQVIRNLSRLISDCDPQALASDGIKRNDEGGLLLVPPMADPVETNLKRLAGGNNDQRIILDALTLQEAKKDVIFVSDDLNARLIAMSNGVTAEEYESGKALHEGDDIPEGLLEVDEQELFSCTDSAGQKKSYKFDRQKLEATIGEPIYPNQFLKYSEEEFLWVSEVTEDQVFGRVYHLGETPTCFGIEPKSAEQAAAIQAVLDKDIPLVVLTGMAGSGKTIVSLAGALEQITCKLEDRKFKKIVVSRSTNDLENDIGFLPGDESEKMGPWLGAFEDNLEAIFKEDADPASSLDYVRTKIHYKTLNFMRGRSFQDTLFILDEAQNLTNHQIKSIVTRIGDGSKIIVLGNIDQIDNAYISKYSSGLTHLIEGMKGSDTFAFVNLKGSPRSRLAEEAGKRL